MRSDRARPLLLGVLAAAAILLLAGCGGGDSGETPAGGGAGAGVPGESFPEAPSTPDGPLDSEVEAAVGELLDYTATGQLDSGALATVAGSDDPRLGWLLSDLLRFSASSSDQDALASAFSELTQTEVDEQAGLMGSVWQEITDRMIAWDLPAPPGYRDDKAQLFTAVEPGWKPFFADADSAIDWRLLSWGGVPIDDRPLGDPDPCPAGCIPALDDPELTPASGGDWYPDDRNVFGVVVGGETVAFPQNIMEIHEMVNITIGGRRVGIPYCTLCGSAQAYLLDSLPAGVQEPVLRTSGLLSRSNKVMYDLRSQSVIDTFSGEALSGPLHDAGVTLRQKSVVASTWGAWKRAHPETEIVAEDGGIGRDYPLDPLGGRDDNGPIFPIGDVDPRLPVQEKVVGAVAPDGRAVAFPVEQATAALRSGGPVTAGGLRAVSDGDGLRVETTGGREVPSHQAFWFAWSQFNPKTLVWKDGG